MSLAKWLAKNGPNALSAAKSFAKANKGPLAAAAAIPAGIGAYELAEPAIDDFMTDQAMKSMGRNLKRGLVDTAEYAEEHPYLASTLLGAAGLAGGAMGQEGFSSAFNSLAPVKIPQRRSRGQR